MTTLTFHPRPTAAPTGTDRGLARVLQAIRRRSASPAPRTAPPVAAPAPDARGCLRLTLHDGVSRLYLLDARDFTATTSPEVAYDARVHAAYVLALQGHRPEWLAQHLDLPLPAAGGIAAQAALSGPDGPGTMPPLT